MLQGDSVLLLAVKCNRYTADEEVTALQTRCFNMSPMVSNLCYRVGRY